MSLVAGIVAGVGELIERGIMLAQQREEAVEVLVRNMKATPSDAEVEEYDAAKKVATEEP